MVDAAHANSQYSFFFSWIDNFILVLCHKIFQIANLQNKFATKFLTAPNIVSIRQIFDPV
jgi:hypothetical protein